MLTRKYGFRFWSAFSVVLLCLVGVAPAFSQTADAQRTTATTPPPTVQEPDRFNVTGFIGPGFGGGLQGNAVDLGAAAGYNWTDRIGFEGEFSFARQGGTNIINTSSNTETFSANALYSIPYKTWLPYGTFGIGAVHGSATVTLPGQVNTISEGATNFAWNLGAGVKKSLNQNIKFRGDLRYFDTGNGLANFWRIYAGINFLLGPR